jgi:hypothetical protein
MLTRRGFDQENNAPDNANETQSTGVPGFKNHDQAYTLSNHDETAKSRSILYYYIICQACIDTNFKRNISINKSTGVFHTYDESIWLTVKVEYHKIHIISTQFHKHKTKANMQGTINS